MYARLPRWEFCLQYTDCFSLNLISIIFFIAVAGFIQSCIKVTSGSPCTMEEKSESCLYKIWVFIPLTCKLHLKYIHFLQLWLILAESKLGHLDWKKTCQFCFNERCNPDDDDLGAQIVKVSLLICSYLCKC